MTEQVKAVDVSNYTGRLTYQQMTALVAAEVEHLVVRLSLEDDDKRAIAQEQLLAGHNFGLSVSGYLWCYWADDPTKAVDDALSLAMQVNVPLTTLWLDAEDPYPISPLLTPMPPVGAWLRAAADQAKARGVRCGIYTSLGWWRGATDNSRELSDLPLWAAEWDHNPDIETWTAFGGWTEIAGKQHAGSSVIDGLGTEAVDLDVFRLQVTVPLQDRPDKLTRLELEIWGPLWRLKDRAAALGRTELAAALVAAVVEDKHRQGVH